MLQKYTYSPLTRKWPDLKFDERMLEGYHKKVTTSSLQINAEINTFFYCGKLYDTFISLYLIEIYKWFRLSII